MISPEDTIVFGYGLLGHLDCRRPRVLSAEERTLLFVYCRDHQVAECVRCMGKFRLREVTSLDLFGIRSHGCPWCHTDLTDSLRAHLYGCAMLPVEVRRRAQAAREAVRSLVQSLQLRGTADGLVRQAEASLHALRETMRQAPTLSATRETKQIKLLSYHILPLHLQIGDRITDGTGEWEVVGPPYSTAGGTIVHTRVQSVGQPASVEVRSWDAFKRISVRRITEEGKR